MKFFYFMERNLYCQNWGENLIKSIKSVHNSRGELWQSLTM